MKFRRGMQVKHIEASPNAPHVGSIMLARHTQDKYLVRWTATLKSGETKVWIQEHSRMVLKPL
jgi:hypothetical protein